MAGRPFESGVRITVRALPDAVVLAVAGELDMLTAPQLREAIFTELRRELAGLILDFEHVTFCASTGVRVVAEAVSATFDAGIPFVVAAVQPNILRVFEIGRLGQVVMLAADVDHAHMWMGAQSLAARERLRKPRPQRDGGVDRS